MKHSLFLNLLIGFLSISAFSQKEITISGTIADAKEEPVSYVDILLKKQDSTQQIVAFDITDNQGRYKITHLTKMPKYWVEVSSLGHKKTRKPLEISNDANRFTLNFTLEERTEELEEVAVYAEAARVSVKNDTTTFNLEKLTNGSERVVEDILKKLPGVKLEANGKIKFKGKDVKNVLLDGDNLFDGGYTLGTKNINAKHIKGVEAIENFEDNPLLQGLSQNDDVALNLKFQDGLSFSGKAELGYGHKERYYANTTGIAVTKKLKGFATLSYSNMGRQASSNYFDPSDFLRGRFGANTFKSPTYITESSQGNLSQGQNSISNNAFFGSLNVLPKLSKTETLRLNMDYFSDRSVQESSSSTLINTDPDNPIVIEQSDRKTNIPRFVNAKLKYRWFASKKTSIEAQLKLSKKKEINNQLGLRNGAEQGGNLRSNNKYAWANTKYTHRITNRSALKLTAVAAYDEAPERLTLISGIDFDSNTLVSGTTNEQQVFAKKQSMNLAGQYYSRNKKNHKFSLDFGLDYFKNRLESDLTDIAGNTVFQNNLAYGVFMPQLTTSYFFKTKTVEIYPKISGKWYNYDYKDLLGNNSQQGNQWLWDTSLTFKYILNKKHSVNASVGSTNTPPDENKLYTDFVLGTNRSLRNNVLNFNKIKAESASIFYRYSDLFKDIDANLGFNYQKSNNAYFSNYTVAQNVSYLTYFLEGFGSKNRNINAGISKYVNGLRSKLSLTGSYDQRDYFNLVNSSDLRENKSNTLSAGFNISTSFIGKFLFSNDLSYSKTEFVSEDINTFTNEGITNKFGVYYIPNDRFRIDSDLNYTVPDVHSSDNRTLFWDLSARYTNKKKNLTYRLEGKNLLDQQDVSFVNNSDFAQRSSTQSLLARYFLLTVSFRF
ncbi:carboxypeptidase regulatory-like domain-containing protein [Maribacter sp. 2304DJ31-5]|uniref:carboxypeptidase regulatory-like domain-containing protein n=1 Tax=Maribacter sp. 2304DJ31-5 TaxID=3386273 RepID=UPI0039BCD69E